MNEDFDLSVFHVNWCDTLRFQSGGSFFRSSSGCCGRWSRIKSGFLLNWDRWGEEFVSLDAGKFASDIVGFHSHDATYLRKEIPKKFHFIWLGGVIPPWGEENMNDWIQNHPGWDVKLWTDADSEEIDALFDVEELEWYRVLDTPVVKSDILRFAILRRYGGVYVDLDFVCLAPFLHLLPPSVEFGYGEKKNARPECALLMSVPSHPFHSWFIWCSQRFWAKISKEEIKWSVGLVWAMNSFDPRVNRFFSGAKLSESLTLNEKKWARTDGKVLSISWEVLHGGKDAVADHRYAHTWW